LEVVEAENLPEFLGGKCKCEHFGGDCMKSDRGPWQAYRMIGPKQVELIDMDENVDEGINVAS